tara:strand:- start:2688 stop:3626 length:939 start_codon:yes stop_codon:yes gene_type:complete
MKKFLNLNRRSLFFQFVAILIVVSVFLYSKDQYVSSVTIHPKLDSRTIISSNGAPLTRNYTADTSVNLYLKELANKETRKEILQKFLSNNQLVCEEEPKIQFYAKIDNSFPLSGHFTVIKVKSTCIGFVKKFVTFLSDELNSKLADQIQRVENEDLEYKRRQLIIDNEDELDDLEMFISKRKEVLQKIIPLLNEEDDKEMSLSNMIFGGEADGHITIPLTRSAAQAELDFLSSITDLKTTSRELVNRTADIERWKIKHDFSDSILVRISKAEPETISLTNLYLTIFFILLILGIGFVQMLLSQFKYHKDKLK